MTEWIILAVLLYALVLFAFNRLGGLGAAAEGLRAWGCAASELCRLPAARR